MCRPPSITDVLEQGNLRVALQAAAEDNHVQLGLRLAAALWPFWHTQGYWTDAAHWLNLFLNRSAGARPALRARVLGPAGRLALDQGDLVRSEALLQACVTLLRALPDRRELGRALNDLAWVALHSGDHARARSLLEEKLTLSRDDKNADGMAYALQHLGLVALEQRDDERASRLLRESRWLMRELGDRRGLAWCLEKLGLVALYQGEAGQAHELFTEALSIFRSLDDQTGIAVLLMRTARSTLQQGHVGKAEGLVRDSLQRLEQMGDTRNLVACLETAAVLAVCSGRDLRAVQLWATVDTLRAGAGFPRPPADQVHDAGYWATTRERIDETTWTRTWAAAGRCRWSRRSSMPLRTGNETASIHLRRFRREPAELSAGAPSTAFAAVRSSHLLHDQRSGGHRWRCDRAIVLTIAPPAVRAVERRFSP